MNSKIDERMGQLEPHQKRNYGCVLTVTDNSETMLCPREMSDQSPTNLAFNLSIRLENFLIVFRLLTEQAIQIDPTNLTLGNAILH